jgi:fumarylacetoacetase
LTWNGAEPIRLPGGEQRTFLQDGDELTLTGYCIREGFTRIGMGICLGTILAADEHESKQ